VEEQMQALVEMMSCDQEGPLKVMLKLSHHPEHAATLPAQVHITTKLQEAFFLKKN
jgi:hypothetical protein